MFGLRLSHDERETKRLLDEVRGLRSKSYFKDWPDTRNFVINLLAEVCDESDLCISAAVAEPLGNIVLALLQREPFLCDYTLAPVTQTLKEAANLRERIKRSIAVLRDEERLLWVWHDAVKAVLIGIVSDLPVAALIDPFPDGSVPDTPVLSAYKPLAHMVGDLPHMLTSILGTLCAGDLARAGLFYDASLEFDTRLCIASGVAWEDRFKSVKRMRLPIDRADMEPCELAELYTQRTPFEAFFDIPIPISVPNSVRFEHTHIVGGTGHGKTQLLQYLIMDDLHRALAENLSLVVIDPDGALIKTISQTDYFGEYLLADRTIFIDPSEVDRPVSLNLFDVSHLDGADARTRESVENNTIELFEYFFDALLGSELTGKQSTLFRYLGLLLMQIPGGNIHTLRALLEDVRPFKAYIDNLPDTARAFFETRFQSRDLQATKTQVLSRLWGVLSNRSLDRVLSGTQNSVNLDEALQAGKIIFIHTSKENLGEEGSAIFARMMVAMIGQALIRRAALPPQDRTDTFIYIDEAEGVVDQTLVRLLAQTRKYRGAITISHQHLDQLSASARAGVFANTSIKLCGGISAKDATALAPEMRTKPDHLLSFRKDKDVSKFAFFAKNYTETAMTLEVPLGYAEGWERLDETTYAALLDQSRECYSWDGRRGGEILKQEPPSAAPADPDESVLPPEPVPKTVDEPKSVDLADEPPPDPVIRKEGGGGARHQAICQTIKELGEAAGFRASVEETILDGEGRVDIILRQADRAIAFEVSVTTSREHELLNVRKCLRAGFGEIVVVAALPRHLVSLERFIGQSLGEGESGLARFVLADDLGGLFEGQMTAAVSEKVVRGYRVRSSQTAGKVAIQNALMRLSVPD